MSEEENTNIEENTSIEENTNIAGTKQTDMPSAMPAAEVVEAVNPSAEQADSSDDKETYDSIQVKNPRIGKVFSLKEEAERQNELEQQRSRRIRQQQEYIDQMLSSVEENIRNTKEEQKINEEFEWHIKNQVYRMHGISEDKLEGMREARRAWYQGAAFALFFLSLVLIVMCGLLHGFGSGICIFMAFYTAIEGTLLSNGRKQSRALEVLIKILYLLLFPMMLGVFVCYELGFSQYELLVPIFTVAGTVVLVLGAFSYFTYDPYRIDRRNRKKANHYLREMEKAALKEVKLKEKAYDKLERKREKNEIKSQNKEKRAKERQERKEEKSRVRAEKKQARSSVRMERKQKNEQAGEENMPQQTENGEENNE